jgi:hypothetical protein
MKGKKKGQKIKDALKHKANITVRPRVFYGPFIPIWYFINLTFWYPDPVRLTAIGVLSVHVTFNMLKLLDDIYI